MSSGRHILSHYDPAVRKVYQALELAHSSKASNDVIKTLESAVDLIQRKEQYTESCSTQPSDACKNILTQTFTHDWGAVHKEGKTTWNLQPGMMTGYLEGQFIKSIVSMHKCKKILDVGMFTGYSALSMAEALPADGKLITLDQDNYLKELVENSFFSKSPHGKKIEIRIGSAMNSIKQLVADKEQFDIIFLDASQQDYIDYFKFIFGDNLLRPGGSLLIDNAFIYGSGYLSSEDNTKTFTHKLASDSSLHKVLVPIRDGVLIVRRMTDVEGSVN